MPSMPVPLLEEETQVARHQHGLIENYRAAGDLEPGRITRPPDHIVAHSSENLDLALKPRPVDEKVGVDFELAVFALADHDVRDQMTRARGRVLGPRQPGVEPPDARRDRSLVLVEQGGLVRRGELP